MNWARGRDGVSERRDCWQVKTSSFTQGMLQELLGILDTVFYDNTLGELLGDMPIQVKDTTTPKWNHNIKA